MFIFIGQTLHQVYQYLYIETAFDDNSYFSLL